MNTRWTDLYDACAGRLVARREFVTGAVDLVGGAAVVAALVPAITAQADIVPKDDPRLHTEWIRYSAPAGEMRAYLARQKEEKKRPAVVVIHENRGLTPHIQDVARRMALEGFLTLAPDALSPMGGTPEDTSQVPALIGKLDAETTARNFVAAVQYLKTHPLSTGKVGCTGFCWGGGMTNQVAVRSPDLLAAVPYYGMQPALQDVPKIKAALLLQYAGNDERINRGIPAFEEALKKAKVESKIYIYQGAQHAFNNDTNPDRYNKEAADLAWKRTIAFFKEKLQT
ncbi:MAG: dienelactone hydrolase family protein [Planctomycetes bacterium]|nr:dienelactone hydrolase family protein [Planctomycetota bacterium]